MASTTTVVDIPMWKTFGPDLSLKATSDTFAPGTLS
jgi:hypothetical protein